MKWIWILSMGWFGKIAISERKGCARLYILEPKTFDVSGRVFWYF